jgi:hypothetical protein
MGYFDKTWVKTGSLDPKPSRKLSPIEDMEPGLVKQKGDHGKASLNEGKGGQL